jgi:putative endonuclease
MISLLYRLGDAARRKARGGGASGAAGEDLAHRYLRRRGCRIVARNYRPRAGHGEIDLVAWHGEALVFVEVKTRSREDFGTPDRAIDIEKRASLVRAASEYARRASIPWNHVRFDVVNVVLLRPARVEWIQDAFRAVVDSASSGSV